MTSRACHVSHRQLSYSVVHPPIPQGILKWVAQIDQNGTEEEKLIRSKCNNFIEWLQQEEDDEEEEEDDD